MGEEIKKYSATEKCVQVFLVLFSIVNFYLSYNLNSELQDLQVAQKLTIEELNVTRHLNQNALFFNRITKVGSSSFADVLKKLSFRNGFRFYTYNIGVDGFDRETVTMGPV